jgi:hypothetical protein
MRKQHYENIEKTLTNLQMIFAESQHAMALAEWLTDDEAEECLFLICKMNSYLSDLRLCLKTRCKKVTQETPQYPGCA